MQNLWKIPIPLLVTGLSLWIAFNLFPQVHPLGGLKLNLPREQIISAAESVLESIGFDPGNFVSEMNLRRNRDLISELQEGLGITTANAMLREKIPGYYWEIRWSEKSDTDKQSADWSKEDVIQLRFNTSGELIYFSRNIPDSTGLPAIGINQAKAKAMDFVRQFTSFKNLNARSLIADTLSERTRVHISEAQDTVDHRDNLLQRRDYDFTWRTTAQGVIQEIKLNALVKGDQLALIELDYITSVAEKADFSTGYSEIFSAIIYFVIFVMVLILAVRQIRTYDLNFNLAVKVSIFVAAMVLISAIPDALPMRGWLLVAVLFLSTMFIGGIFILLWAVSETVGRETWKDKFIEIDLLSRGHLLHSRIGISLMNGIAAGVLSFTVFLGILWVCLEYQVVSIVMPDNETVKYIGYDGPFIYLIPKLIWNGIYSITVAAVLIASLVYLKLKWKILAVAAGAIILAAFTSTTIIPAFLGIIFYFIAFAIILLMFARYDILTAFTALTIFSICGPALAIISEGPTSFILSGMAVTYILVALLTPDKIRDFSEIEPALSRIISERQHMRQQLEVARSIQMSFLPRTNPVFEGLEIDARCIPAYEVGGDYFDFIQISPQKLAIAIGDVSGKGTKAAFYMTLVKGFLRALTRSQLTPVNLLKELNTLFYENTKRDAFISLIYGIFDMNDRSVRLARSGHSPVMLYQAEAQSVRMITTEGLALGLESGELYNRMIQEQIIPLQPGDVFLFYTDGVTEAMNRTKEEFGEGRLKDVLLSYGTQNAGAILKKVLSEVSRFSRLAKQHDDMTLIVVKII